MMTTYLMTERALKIAIEGTTGQTWYTGITLALNSSLPACECSNLNNPRFAGPTDFKNTHNITSEMSSTMNRLSDSKKSFGESAKAGLYRQGTAFGIPMDCFE